MDGEQNPTKTENCSLTTPEKAVMASNHPANSSAAAPKTSSKDGSFSLCKKKNGFSDWKFMRSPFIQDKARKKQP